MARDIQKLMSNLHSDDWMVRRDAASQLEREGNAGAVPALIGALQDQSQFVRLVAAKALGKLGDTKAVAALIQLLDDPAFIVRQTAMWSLGDLGDPSAIPALSSLVDDKSWYAERELLVGQIADLAIKRIKVAVQAKSQPAVAPAEGETVPAAAPAQPGVLSLEERKARREAALARKAAANKE